MKTAFFEKVATSTTTIQTGRYLYEYDKKRRAVHVVDTKGVVDKWVLLSDCEDYAPTTSAPTPKAAPKAKSTSKATPAPQVETVTMTKAELADLVAAAVQSALATINATPAPTPKATPKAKSAPAKKSAPKVAKPLADHDGKLSKAGKSVLKAVQAWAKKTRRPVEISVNGSWIWVSGTEKNDRIALKEMGFRWRNSRQMWSWDDTLAKKSA